MSSTSNGPLLSLKFVIVGGGVAGLSTAFALQRAGHHVVVLEKKDAENMSFGNAGGGIRATPNMTRLLYRWGLGPVLARKALKCERLVYVNANTSRLLGAMVLNEEFLRDLVADMLLIKHGDLINMLHDLASREGVEIRHNTNVVYANPDGSSVRLDTGETIWADLVIVADGFSSLIRSQVMENLSESQTEPLSRVLFVAFTIDAQLLEEDEDFKGASGSKDWLAWIAEDTIVHTYIDKEGNMIGTFSRDYYGEVQEGDEEWSDKRNLESYGLDFTLLDPRLRRIFEMSKTVTSRIFLKRSMPEELVNEHSAVVLVGEAAHPLVCDGNHGTALVIEDAETLGSLFSEIRCRSEICQRLAAYEEIRHPRCVQTNFYHQRLDSILKLPVGSRQKSRDVILRRTLASSEVDHMDPDEFQAGFGDQLISFAYDAGDAVDSWWAQWGYSSKHMRRRSPPLEVWITRS
jgi:salicylate hydroxylase